MDLMWPAGVPASTPVYRSPATADGNADFFEQNRQYLTTDESTLRWRQDLFRDILSVEGLGELLILLREKLSEYTPLMRSPDHAAQGEEQLRRLLYPAAYIELVALVRSHLGPMMENICAESLKQLHTLAEADAATPEFARLEAYYRENTADLGAIRSVTVGINLDALYRPKEAGIIALHREEYRSGDLLDRILRLDFARDEFHCIAPLTMIDSKLGFGESQQVNYAFLKAMGRVLDRGLSHCSKRLLRYARNRIVPYFSLLDSLSFVTDAIRWLDGLRKNDIPLCFPAISRDGSARILSLYDDVLAHDMGKSGTVPNNIRLEKGVCCYLLTGPNSGGKTVFLRAMTSAQCCFQLGMPIPAREAALPLFDGIFSVSPAGKTGIGGAGRFEGECMILSNILDQFGENSLLLLDEAFTSTSPDEALPLAAELIARLCEKGGKCILVTHLHGLSEVLDGFPSCKGQVDYLHTEMLGEQRTYTVLHGKAPTHSGAREIARKYGLWE